MSTPFPGKQNEVCNEATGKESWPAPPADVRLVEGEVHLWRACLAGVGSPDTEMGALLSPEELDRAARFHFTAHRDRFMRARAILRCLLAGYLECAPSAVAFVYNPEGKPALDPHVHTRPIEFNLSHSEDMALYGMVLERPIGADLEAARKDREFFELARRFFARDEVDALALFTGDVLKRAFYKCWTQKEAFVKARGGGLSIPLDVFSVNVVPDEPAALLRCSDADPEDLERWTLRMVDVHEMYTAAVAVEGHGLRFQCWTSSACV